MTYYLGIDLTSSERRPSAWASLDEAAHILDLGQVTGDDAIMALVERLQPASTAIDAPLYLPRGLASLDDDKAAQGLPTGRACERQLKALGIGCFYTTPSSIIKPMVYRAIALRRRLEARGHLVLEVFPYASKVRLLGMRHLPKKTCINGRLWLQSALVTFIPDLSASPPLSHDALDALIAAYTGLLHANGLAVGLGEPDEGILWIPEAHTIDTPRTRLL